jgi:hypothetical protein
MMGASGSLKMAEYGIAKMKEKTPQYEFYIVGVLACLRGAMDYLLEEYNQKFGLGMGLDEVLTTRSFRERARDLGDREASEFIDAYEEEKKKLLSEKKVDLILGWQGLRDLYIHRTQVPKDVGIGVTVGISLSASVEVRDADGKVVARSPPSPPPPPSQPPEVKYYLREWKDDDVDTLCEYSLAKVTEFVSLMRNSFPMPPPSIRSILENETADQ